jgi:hypothetical protein
MLRIANPNCLEQEVVHPKLQAVSHDPGVAVRSNIHWRPRTKLFRRKLFTNKKLHLVGQHKEYVPADDQTSEEYSLLLPAASIWPRRQATDEIYQYDNTQSTRPAGIPAGGHRCILPELRRRLGEAVNHVSGSDAWILVYKLGLAHQPCAYLERAEERDR